MEWKITRDSTDIKEIWEYEEPLHLHKLSNLDQTDQSLKNHTYQNSPAIYENSPITIKEIELVV